MGGVVRGEQDPLVRGGQPIPALFGVVSVGAVTSVVVGDGCAVVAAVGLRADDLDETGDGLLLEPLPRVPGRDGCPLGQLRVGQGPPGQGLVETELAAEVDAEELERGDGGTDEAVGERVGGSLLGEGLGEVLVARRATSGRSAPRTVSSGAAAVPAEVFMVPP